MQIVSQYLQHAFECLKKAAEATDREAQDSLRRLGRKWMLLAEHGEKSVSRNASTMSLLTDGVPLMEGVPHPDIAQTENKDSSGP
jgi:hypothetical protein